MQRGRHTAHRVQQRGNWHGARNLLPPAHAPARPTARARGAASTPAGPAPPGVPPAGAAAGVMQASAGAVLCSRQCGATYSQATAQRRPGWANVCPACTARSPAPAEVAAAAANRTCSARACSAAEAQALSSTALRLRVMDRAVRAASTAACGHGQQAEHTCGVVRPLHFGLHATAAGCALHPRRSRRCEPRPGWAPWRR